MEKIKPRKSKGRAEPSVTIPAPTPAATPAAPLFRRVDWLAFGISFLLVFIGYCLTLTPALTLEDSGELAVASHYAGIPHAPGYPVWTLFTWLWTLIPYGNIAWRVALSCAFAGALSSALLSLVVSRSSGMLLRSIADFKSLEPRWEHRICLVAGVVAGMLIGFNGYMWSQATIVEVYALSVLSLMGVVVCLLRWMYAPRQHRYLYWAFFLYGICFNNHQSLLVIAMGMQVLIWLAEPKLGRELLFWNTLIYLAGMILQPSMLSKTTSVFVIFNVVGIASAILWLRLVVTTKKTSVEFARDGVMLATFACAGMLFLGITNYLPAVGESGFRMILIAFVGVISSVAFARLIKRTFAYSREWLIALGCGFAWLVGAAFYFYEPIAGMTNPPMQWAYPRTVEGFIHALTRGQYEPIRPTSGTGEGPVEIVGSFLSTYGMQLWRFLEGLNDEFNFLFLLIAPLFFLFYRKLQKRERVWILGMIAIFICLGPFLVLLLNFSSDRQSLELNRVFLTSSHLFVAMAVGSSLALIAAALCVHGQALKKFAFLGGLCVLDFALFLLAINSQIEFPPDKVSLMGFAKVLCWLGAIGSLAFVRHRGVPNRNLSQILPGGLLAISGILTVAAFLGDALSFRNIGVVFQSIVHAFGPDQYGLPIFAALLLVAAALIFLLSVWRTQFASAGVALILFATIPAYSVMTHWFDNEQRGHLFGYWYGHDMFTPPFTAPDGSLSYDPNLREQAMAGSDGKLVYPEMARDAILFGGTDPGRFCPTYMIFSESLVAEKYRPAPDPKFDRRDVYIITQNALADPPYLNYIRAHYFRSDQYQYDSYFFQELLRGPQERAQNLETNIIARVAAKVLDGPLTRRGAKLEAKWRKEGVYPPKEIYTPNPKDAQIAFQAYAADAQARLLHDKQNPNAPRRVKPGENVEFINGQIYVSGQIAVMGINAGLTRVIFDKNPEHEFYLEESYPLDWMYPHLTPYGIIMKINRSTVPEFNEEILRRDHEFWSKYSERLIGDWITYDTPVKEITDFVERVYLRRNFKDFTGDRRFIRDNVAQKSFSNLRGCIVNLYLWRLGVFGVVPTPPQYLPKTQAERAMLLREAEFGLRQAFAYCPFNLQVVMNYVQLLVSTGRVDEGLLVAQTCLKLDPYNQHLAGIIDRLHEIREQMAQQGFPPGSAPVPAR